MCISKRWWHWYAWLKNFVLFSCHLLLNVVYTSMTFMVNSLCREGDLDGRLYMFGSLMLELLVVSTVTGIVCLVFVSSMTGCLFEPHLNVNICG